MYQIKNLNGQQLTYIKNQLNGVKSISRSNIIAPVENQDQALIISFNNGRTVCLFLNTYRRQYNAVAYTKNKAMKPVTGTTLISTIQRAENSGRKFI